MKAYFIFAAGGPLIILTSYTQINNPNLLNRLTSKGIDKFVACEIPVRLARERYGNHFDVVCRDLHEADDLRILDYNGARIFKRFTFAELGSPIYHESSSENIISRLELDPEMHLSMALSEMGPDEL